MSNKLKEFLLGCEVSNSSGFTHTSLNGETPAGKYNIPNTKHETFWKIYDEHVFTKGRQAFLTEKHPEKYSMVIVDIDLRYELSDDNTRKYTMNLILDLVMNYHDAFQILLGQSMRQNESFAYVLEKENPEVDESKGVLKDGIHIIFPFLYLAYPAQHWARKFVIKKMTGHSEFSNCTISIDKIIDESVVERNNFIMYGSQKPTSQHRYLLTHIFDLDMNEAEELPLNDWQLVKTLSLQRRGREITTLLDNILAEEAKIEEEKRVLQRDILLPEMQIQQKKSKAYLKTLLGLLKSERIEDYNDWFLIGAILHNEGEDNLDLWKEWSSQSRKYNETHCDRLWSRTYPNCPDDRRARVGTLQMFARMDSPKNYFTETDKFESEDDLIKLINKSFEITHSSFAELCHFVLRDNYRHSNNTWFSFDKKRWRGLKETVPLLNDIAINVKGLLIRYSSMLGTKIADKEASTHTVVSEKDHLKFLKNACDSSVKKLNDHNYKISVANECKLFFADEDFYKNLDMNIYLLGFNNGVYDLKAGIFRESRPEDLISFTTGYDYTPVIHSEIRAEIEDLFEKSLPDPSVREFMYLYMASTLIGRNKNELFMNFEGSGGNGKGVITKLHDYALGDYAGTLDNAYITNVSSSQEGHNSKLIAVFKKRYVQVNEPPKGKTLNQDFIKELTGNDKIQVRKAHSPDPEIEDAPMFKLVMLCNKMPKIEDSTDGGLIRRYKGVNFPNRFVTWDPKKPNEFRADPNLKTRLAEIIDYRQQYMIILLEYVRRYIESDEKIAIPELVEKNSRQILRSQDFYADFVEECIEITGTPTDVLSVKELLDDYKIYYGEYVSNGSKMPPMTQKEFTDRMIRCFADHPLNVEFKNMVIRGDLRLGKGFVGVRRQSGLN